MSEGRFSDVAVQIYNVLPRMDVVSEIAGSVSPIMVKKTAMVNRIVRVYDSFSPHSTGTTKTNVTRNEDRTIGSITLTL